MNDDETRTALVPVVQTSVAVPTHERLFAAELKGLPAEKPLAVGLALVLGAMGAGFLYLATKVDPDLDLVGARLVWPLALMGCFLIAMGAFGAWAALFRRTRRIEVTQTTISAPSWLPPFVTTFLRDDVNATHVAVVHGQRSLVVATPSRMVAIPQRLLPRDEWDRLLDVLEADRERDDVAVPAPRRLR